LLRRTVLGSGLSLAAASTTLRATSAFAQAPRVPPASDGASTSSALRLLAERSKASKSDAVLVFHDGKKVFEYYSGEPKPIFLMSCTKSIASLAVGRAIADGKIKSLDQPLYDFYPELKQGRKAAMTVRHLLSMTSGIQNTGSGNEVYPAPDFVRLALAAELTTAPGATFSYNNKAVNLVSGVIHIATNESLDDYVRDSFFEPMDIESWNWGRDDAGNASAMADLALYPEDFAKFGTLMLQGGQWNGKQLVPADWVKQSGLQSQPDEPRYGLLWWRLPGTSAGVLSRQRVSDLAKAGLSPPFVAALRRLEGRTFRNETEWHHALQDVFPAWTEEALKSHDIIDGYAEDVPVWRYADFDGISAVGYLGQYLVVYPDRKLVGVRMIKPFDAYDYNANRFEDFADVVREVAPPA
jgi:CubicO group peptidase (beta-lactamase class C family)